MITRDTGGALPRHDLEPWTGIDGMSLEDALIRIFAELLTRWANDLAAFDLETEAMMTETVGLEDGDALVQEQIVLDRAETSRRGWQQRQFTFDMAMGAYRSMNDNTTKLLEDF
jgi:hypothetical protein